MSAQNIALQSPLIHFHSANPQLSHSGLFPRRLTNHLSTACRINWGIGHGVIWIVQLICTRFLANKRWRTVTNRIKWNQLKPSWAPSDIPVTFPPPYWVIALLDGFGDAGHTVIPTVRRAPKVEGLYNWRGIVPGVWIKEMSNKFVISERAWVVEMEKLITIKTGTTYLPTPPFPPSP